MKDRLNSLDIAFLVEEFQRLVGARVDKVYQIGAREFKIDLRGKSSEQLIITPDYLCLSSFKYETSKKPSMLSVLLRKTLSGGIIKSVNQVSFDRIIEFEIDKREGVFKLVLELFSKGNLLVLDESGAIVILMERQEWKDRAIKKGAIYSYPPEVVDPFKLSFAQFKEKYDPEKELVKFLAADMGFGGSYAEELCVRCGLEKKETELDEKRLKKVYDSILSLKKEGINAQIVLSPKPVDVTPFEFKSLEGERKDCESFNSAVDEYFRTREVEEKKTESGASKELERFKTVKREQDKALKKQEREGQEFKEKGDVIYAHFQELDELLKKAHGEGHWIAILRGLGISEFIEKEKRFKWRELWIYVDKSVTENAEEYYKKSKKSTAKIKGTQEAILEVNAKIAVLEKRGEKAIERIESGLIQKKTRDEWFEKFRWFKSSEGFLTVGGKNATSNEILVKKHTEPSDLVFHSSVHGAPFFIIKNPEKREIGAESKQEAAEAAASYSSAWKAGWGSADVYAIGSDQVSKQAQSGEYLSKGAFMIRGDREWFKGTPLKIAIGFVVEREGDDIMIEVIGGPESAIASQTPYYANIGVGNVKSGELARDIRSTILRKTSKEDGQAIKKMDLGDIQRWIPAGKGMIIK
jgi:predicted ribosome quality control (RQC) complex YloA/Tae2 family protein